MTKPENGPDFVSPVVGVGGAWVRPGELLVSSTAGTKVTERLRKFGGRPYKPTGDKTDWRQFRNAPEYGDINQRLERAGLKFRLWTGFTTEDAIKLARDQNLPGVDHNTVLIGEDYYQGGPVGAPAAWSGPAPTISYSGDHVVDIAVLDSGVPVGWAVAHAALKDSVEQVGINRLPQDPLDEDGVNGPDAQAGHGLFVCGVVARVAPALNIQLSRVLHATGETDVALICAGLVESTARVVNLSLGGYTDGDKVPQDLVDTVKAVHNAGRVIVAAAGNAGDTKPGSPYAGRKFWPAVIPEVIAVGACDTTSTTETYWAESNRGEIYAPGVNVVSTYLSTGGFNGWATWSGTSFATPAVAAAIADLLDPPFAGNVHQTVQTWLNARDTRTWPQVGTVKVFLPPLT